MRALPARHREPSRTHLTAISQSAMVHIAIDAPILLPERGASVVSVTPGLARDFCLSATIQLTIPIRILLLRVDKSLSRKKFAVFSSPRYSAQPLRPNLQIGTPQAFDFGRNPAIKLSRFRNLRICARTRCQASLISGLDRFRFSPFEISELSFR